MDCIVGQTLKNNQICLCREIVPVTARLNLCPTTGTMAGVSLFEGDQKGMGSASGMRDVGEPGRVNTHEISPSRRHESPAKHIERHSHFETACALDDYFGSLEAPLCESRGSLSQGQSRGTMQYAVSVSVTRGQRLAGSCDWGRGKERCQTRPSLHVLTVPTKGSHISQKLTGATYGWTNERCNSDSKPHSKRRSIFAIRSLRARCG